ncbi:MAG: glycosyltransferase family 2 protein [Lutisporaceae bacterium]
MKRPLVTFSMQAYNAEKYIEKSIESILNQSIGDIELILINNASTDRTGEICRNFAAKDSRIIFHENEKNTILNPEYKGKWVCPNGEYFAYLDSDDYLDLNFVKVMYEAATKHDSDIVVCGTELFMDKNPDAKRLRIPPAMATKDTSELAESFAALYGSLRPLWGKLYKTDFFLEHGVYAFDRPNWLLSGSDTFAVLRYLGKCKSFVSIDRVLHYYRIYEDSYYNANVNIDRIRECNCLYEEGINLLKGWDAVTNKRVNFLLGVHFQSIRDCLNNAANNINAPLRDRLNLIQAIVTDDMFCSYSLSDRNRNVALNEVENYVNRILKGFSSIDIANSGRFFIASMYRVLKKSTISMSNGLAALLLSSISSTENKYLWGIDYLERFHRVMPEWVNGILQADPSILPRLLKNKRLFREFINGDFESAIAIISEEENISSDIHTLTKVITSFESAIDLDILNQYKLRISEYLDKGNLEEAIPLLISLTESRILDREGIYYKMYIAWQIGEKELAIDAAEIAEVFWSEDVDIMVMCGDIFVAIGAINRALMCYQRAIDNSVDEEYKKKISIQIEKLK